MAILVLVSMVLNLVLFFHPPKYYPKGALDNYQGLYVIHSDPQYYVSQVTYSVCL